MQLKKRTILISSLIGMALVLASLHYFCGLFDKLALPMNGLGGKKLDFSTYANLDAEAISETRYYETVYLHNECFEPDRIKYLALYLTEVKYPDASPVFRQLLEQQVANQVKLERAEKLKNFRRNQNITLAKYRDKIVGLYNCHYDDSVTQGSIMIYNVCVAKKHRGKGFGMQLMQHAINHCQEAGKRLTLTVYKDNTAAIELYKKLNFVIIPLEKQPHDDFIIFQKYLMQYQTP